MFVHAWLVEVVPNSTVAADACSSLALVPIGLTTWWRSNQASVSESALRFSSAGLAATTVHATQPGEADVPINATVAALPHLAYRLKQGFCLGLSTTNQAIHS